MRQARAYDVNSPLVPTYQYACTECGHTFDLFQSFTDDTLEHCPECGGRLRKVFNAVGVVFKGSGFYRNDSRTAAKADSTSSGAAKTPPTGGTGKDSSSSSGDSSSGSSSESSKTTTAPEKSASKATSSSD
jgi:putative FmdB family regulatory protein